MSATSEPNLFDPSLFPMLLPRLEELCALLIEAARDHQPSHTSSQAGAAQSHSQSQSQQARLPKDSSGPDPAQPTVSAASLPSFLLGATSEEEPTYESLGLGSSSGNSLTNFELQDRIVSAAQGLKATLAATQKAIEELPGGEMSVAKQQETLKLLEGQLQRQIELERSFVSQSAFASESHASSEAMDTS